MKRAAIEIDDVAVLVKTDDTTPPMTSPSVALVEDGGLTVGDEAHARRRLEPRRIHNTFWHEPSTEQLQRPYPGGYSTADICHAHLEHCWRTAGVKAEGVVLCMPGDVSIEGLGLVVGIAHAAGVPVVGLVDAAVAGSADHGPPEACLHLEIFGNRTVVTALEPRSKSLRAIRTEVEDSVGCTGFEKAWARRLAAEFVKSTRFDPLDRAQSEQLLHDHLWSWVDLARRDGAVRLEIEAGDRIHGVDIAADLFIESGAELYQTIEDLVARVLADEAATRLFIGSRAVALPRLVERLREACGLEVSMLPLAAAAEGALRHAGTIVSRDSDIVMVKELETGSSWQLPLAKPAEGSPGVPTSSGRRPTHIVHSGLAYRIPPEGLVVGIAPPPGSLGLTLVGTVAGVSRRHLTIRREGLSVVVEDHSRYGTLLNDARLEAVSTVVAGDRLRVGDPGIELELITMVEGDGPA